jgi:hypothetical protein
MKITNLAIFSTMNSMTHLLSICLMKNRKMKMMKHMILVSI